jgi:hypothetical protein
MTMVPQFAAAETFRCTFDRTISVTADGRFEDNKKGGEIFIVVDGKNRTGRSSGGSEFTAVVRTIPRSITPNEPFRLITLYGNEELWVLDKKTVLMGGETSDDYTAVVVSVSGNLRETRSEFGQCRAIIK